MKKHICEQNVDETGMCGVCATRVFDSSRSTGSILREDGQCALFNRKCQGREAYCPTKCKQVGVMKKHMNDIETEYDFQQAVEQVMDWISKNGHPHMKVVIEDNRAEVLSGEHVYKTDAFLRD